MKGRILFIVAVVVFVALVPVVYWVLFERGLAVSTPAGPAPMAPRELEVRLAERELEPAPMALSVAELQGRVEITRGEPERWQAAEEGMVLAAKDRIRTQRDSRATLAMPGVFSVRLTAESEFEVRHLAEDAYRFLLEHGMIEADVIDDPERLFEVAASAAVATTQGGSFRMNVNREGLVALGTSRGSVDLESGGKVVQVREGYMALVERGKAPEDPIRIPRRLFLKVRWPARSDLSSRKLTVSGRTDRGARVRVEGVTVEVDSRGRFRTLVTLREGVNRVKVESEDVGGNDSARRSPKIQVDTRADQFQIETSPGMWEKRRKTHP